MIIYKGYAVKALRADLMPLAQIIDDAPVTCRADPAGQPLMVLPASALKAKKPRVKRRGHAVTPGTGPAGETCGGCIHRVSVRGGNRAFSKCELSRARWTGGAASDIRIADPACAMWKSKQQKDTSDVG